MRKVEYVTVPAEWGGRDAPGGVGKVFKITEKPALQAEKWAWRLIIAVKGTTAAVPENLAGLGYGIIFLRGLNSFLAADIDWGKFGPLLDEMFECVEIVRDPTVRDQFGELIASKLVGEDDVEEVRTVGWLRSEVLRVHANFSFIDSLLSWLATANSLPSSEAPTR